MSLFMMVRIVSPNRVLCSSIACQYAHLSCFVLRINGIFGHILKLMAIMSINVAIFLTNIQGYVIQMLIRS